MTVVVRTSGTVPGLADQLRRTAQSIGPRVLVERIRIADDLFADRVITPKRRTVLLTLLGALGLTLALVGVFGMTGYAVTRRTPEIGVRMAFGARPGQVVRHHRPRSALPIVIGVASAWARRCSRRERSKASCSRQRATIRRRWPPSRPTLALTGCVAAVVPAIARREDRSRDVAAE